jgi:hypothetical protein
MLKNSNDTCPFVTSWDNKTPFSFTITKGEGWNGQALSPPVGTVIEAGATYASCLFDYIIVDIHTDPGGKGDYLGTASVSVKGTGDGRYVFDSNNKLVFSYDAAHSKYYGPCEKWVRAQDVSAPGISNGPSVVTNAGWSNGMGNNDAALTEHESFWGLDYGTDAGRWTARGGAIYQSTSLVDKNVGSRAFPIYLSTGSPTWLVKNCQPNACECSNTVAPGVAYNGCWQIDMRVGSSGQGPFCETFYLAERASLEPGVSNYQDGSGSAPGGASREIDIMETRWQPLGPQANCPSAGGTTWSSQFSNVLMGKWADIGGLPMTGFVTFGCLIRDKNMWIYGYTQAGKLWYCSEVILLDNNAYVQKNPFVPYIGTWSSEESSGGFETGYKNFVYLKQDDAKINSLNPKDHPESFGPALRSPIRANL